MCECLTGKTVTYVINNLNYRTEGKFGAGLNLTNAKIRQIFSQPSLREVFARDIFFIIKLPRG